MNIVKGAVDRLCRFVAENALRAEAAASAERVLRMHFAQWQPDVSGDSPESLGQPVRSVLYGLHCVGSLPLEFTSAKEGLSDRVRDGKLDGAIRFKYGPHELNDVHLIPSEKRHHDALGRHLAALSTALLWQPAETQTDVHRWRTENVMGAVRLIAVCGLAGHERKIWLAKPWLDLTHRAVIYGYKPLGTCNSWHVFA